MTVLAKPKTADERERARRLRERMNASEEDYAPQDQATHSNSAALVSAAGHTGAMIALVPTAVDTARLAVDGGELAEELHVTLGYLGEAALIPQEVQRAVAEAVGYCVADRVSIVGSAFAVAMFNPNTSDVTAAFDPNQPRDANGRWARTGNGSKPDFDPQQLAIHYYTGAGFRKLNQALRSGGDLSKVPSRPVFLERNGKFVDVEVSPVNAVANLDVAIAASPLETSRTFYRGTSLTPPSVGSVIVDNGYTSTSRTEKGAGYFLGGDGALWEIHAPAGAHALDIDEGPNTHEQETVLPRGSSLRVRELLRDENDRVVRVIADLMENDQLTAAAGGREPCVVLLVAGQQLPGFHEYVMRSVEQVFGAAGMQLHPQHSPWVAHLTLAYTADADLSYFTDRVGPVTFDRVRVAFGDNVIDLPLGEPTEVDTSEDGG